MQKRTLGRTGHKSTIVTFGSYSIGKLAQPDADKVIQTCLDYGVNHVDIAPTYANAMERIAPWMPEIREKIFLGSKTSMRTRDEAWRNVENIMERMNVNSFDLFQLHSVINVDTLDQVMCKGGALETIIEMKEQGITKWLGITGHGPDVPETHIEALRRFDFDTVMFPVNAAMYSNHQYRTASEKLIEACHSKDVGIQVIKMIARGGWGNSTPDCDTWYDPHRDQVSIDRALWWQLSQPVHTAPSCGEASLLPMVLNSAERFQMLTPGAQDDVILSQSPPNLEPKLAII